VHVNFSYSNRLTVLRFCLFVTVATATAQANHNFPEFSRYSRWVATLGGPCVCVTNRVHLPGAGWRYTDDTVCPWRLSAAVVLARCICDTLQPPHADITRYVVCAQRESWPAHWTHHRHLYTVTQSTSHYSTPHTLTDYIILISSVSFGEPEMQDRKIEEQKSQGGISRTWTLNDH